MGQQVLIRPYFKFAVANLYIIPSSKATKAQKAKKGKEREVGSSSAQDNQTLTLDELNSGSEAGTVDAQVAFWGTKDTNKKKNQTLTPTHTQQHTRYLLKIKGGQGYSEKLKVLWD